MAVSSDSHPAPFPDIPPEQREIALRILHHPEPLCEECRGRAFGRLGHGYSNPERLREVARTVHAGLPPEAGDCSVCRGAFSRIPRWVERAMESGSSWEWNTFRCGSRWDPEALVREETFWLTTGSPWGESIRTAFNREFGKALAAASGKLAAPEPVDVVFLADVGTGLVEVTVFPIYLRGRYRKLDRTLPQTKWPCRVCHGKGCPRCGGKGKLYETSVEELVGAPLLELSGGSGHSFHGMGREDIDARMLGRGRPFVLEISRPHRRTFDLRLAAERIAAHAQGRVEVSDLAFCPGSEVERVKSARPEKTYRVVIRGDVPEAKVKETLPLLVGRELAQETPTRVVHRRADTVRHRTIREVNWVGSDGPKFTLDVRADAGTYIKEFVQGDGGRTRPSLAELLGIPLTVEALDVLEVHDS